MLNSFDAPLRLTVDLYLNIPFRAFINIILSCGCPVGVSSACGALGEQIVKGI
ncbi:MAG: hypothetical protein V4585_14455 [Bacteroidota bacterium]